MGIYKKESDEKVLNYGLRENTKKSFRLADPEFLFAIDAGSFVQDKESENEPDSNVVSNNAKMKVIQWIQKIDLPP